MELDSHADTSVVGRDTALLIHDYETPVRVQGYNEDGGEGPTVTSSAQLWPMTTQHQGKSTCW